MSRQEGQPPGRRPEGLREKAQQLGASSDVTSWDPSSEQEGTGEESARREGCRACRGPGAVPQYHVAPQTVLGVMSQDVTPHQTKTALRRDEKLGPGGSEGQ